jgi:RNA polymerase sigma-70 factor (sigma-E family)
VTPEAEEEFSQFVGARYDRLGRFAYLMCGDWHMAEDAVQRALTKLYLIWTKKAIRQPDAYVRKMIVNALNDERRLGWFRRESVTDVLPEPPVFDPTQLRADQVTVRDALARLPIRQRTAVILRHWEDLSIDQTADIMGCTKGTVKSATARGLDNLRALLSETAPGEVTA